MSAAETEAVLAELTEELAQDIAELAQAFRVLDKSRVRRRAIVLLLADSTGVSRTNIGKLLDVASRLDEGRRQWRRAGSFFTAALVPIPRPCFAT